METKMNADQARLKYFNEYVAFEHNVRRLARKTQKHYRTWNKSLKEIIKEIGIINYQKHLHIKVKFIKAQNKVRNWLAHTPRSTHVPHRHLEHMKLIKEFNVELKKFSVV